MISEHSTSNIYIYLLRDVCIFVLSLYLNVAILINVLIRILLGRFNNARPALLTRF